MTDLTTPCKDPPQSEKLCGSVFQHDFHTMFQHSVKQVLTQGSIVIACPSQWDHLEKPSLEKTELCSYIIIQVKTKQESNIFIYT